MNLRLGDMCLASFSVTPASPTLLMSTTADSKRHYPRHTHNPKVPDQYRSQVQQLQELFPTWSNDGPLLPEFNLFFSRSHLFLTRSPFHLA